MLLTLSRLPWRGIGVRKDPRFVERYATCKRRQKWQVPVSPRREVLRQFHHQLFHRHNFSSFWRKQNQNQYYERDLENLHDRHPGEQDVASILLVLPNRPERISVSVGLSEKMLFQNLHNPLSWFLLYSVSCWMLWEIATSSKRDCAVTINRKTWLLKYLRPC